MSFKFYLLFLSLVICRGDVLPKYSHLWGNKTDGLTNLTPPEILLHNGYPAETHHVQTADGFILELHRIPHGKANSANRNPTPVLLQHGFAGSSATWIMDEPKISLGYRLADEGYDVWMGNSRGNTYSSKHLKYTTDNQEFWNFSFHEMGIYDMPATIDYILNTTGHDQLIYIGYSLGNTMFYVMTSVLPQYNAKIKYQISLAPVGALPHTTTPIATLFAPYVTLIPEIPLSFNTGLFLSTDVITNTIIAIFHNEESGGNYWLQEYLMSLIFGDDHEQFNNKLCTKLWKHAQAGSSLKNLMHVLQLINSGSFRYYDYGKNGNIDIYKSEAPPKYNLGNITAPIKVYYGQSDLFVHHIDVKALYSQFRHPIGLEPIKHQKFNHIDFLFAKDINQLLHDPLIDFIHGSTYRW